MKKYLSLITFSHTVFALPFAVIGYFLAASQSHYAFDWKTFLLVLVCMVSARSAAMAFNRFLDRDVDAKNPRTQKREIPSGKVKPVNALLFTLIAVGIFVAATFCINRICFYLSPVALLVVLGYSFTKRFTSLSHFVLGLGLSLAPIGAYLAVAGKFELTPLLFSLAVLFWVSGFDIIYALQDEEFDKQNKLFSIPAWLGKRNALFLSVLMHLLCAASLCAIPFIYSFGLWYWIGASVFLLLLLYQHLIVKPSDLSRINLAFFTTNGVASLVFAAFVLSDLFLHK